MTPENNPFLPDGWENFSPEQKAQLLAWQEQKQYAFGLKQRPWRLTARNKQLSPDDPKHHLPGKNGYSCGCKDVDGDYRIWLFLGGRGAGKTITGSNWLLEQALKNPGTKWGVASSTASELESVCFRGDSGILSQALPGEADFNINKLRVTLCNGSEIQGYSADSPDRIRGANLHGLWYDEAACLPGDTLVRTSHGEKPIRDITRGDFVWTRKGLRQVSWSGATRRDAELWEITTPGGKLRCTPDHRVLTGTGWRQAQFITTDDIIYLWTNSFLDLPRGSNGTVSAGIASTSAVAKSRPERDITAIQAEISSTALSGSAPTVRFLPVGSSITMTTTRQITHQETWYSSRGTANTRHCILRNGNTRNGAHGREANSSGNGQFVTGLIGKQLSGPALNAKRCSPPVRLSPSSAAIPVKAGTVVTSSGKLHCREAVTYDLTVAGDPEFFADGFLVHNSSRYPRFWYEAARPAVRLGDARMLVTTTPKPTKLLRDLTSRQDGSVHITVGTMFENDFLDEGTKADLRREYEGSRLGRQELYGELLDDFEGALFNRADLDEHRLLDLGECPVMTRIIVGVDPAMKSGEEHDESGIIVAGEGTGPDGYQHAYILEDRSMRGTPQQVMQTVASVFHKWQADSVVLEVNQGGDFIKDALRTVDSSIPVRTVHATKGKVVRAEPVSTLGEQGRLHMVGSFPELEDQLCLMRPGEVSGENDDRSDACIWCIFELRHLSAGSYMDGYGMKTCDCGTVLAKKETLCKKCGKEYEPVKPEKQGALRPSWAAAYMKTCDEGHTYPKSLPRCNKCFESPAEFLQKVSVFTGSQQGQRRTPGLSQIWQRGY